MIKILWNGKTLKDWFHNYLREVFCKREVGRGRILVAWRDVDDMVYGWTMSADEEANLVSIAKIIADTKHSKLVHIVNGKEKAKS